MYYKYFSNYYELNDENNYYEFQKGKWDGKTMWKKDSLYVRAEIMDSLLLNDLIDATVLDYDMYYYNVLEEYQWNAVKIMARRSEDKVLIEAVNEIQPWIDSNFKTNDCFSILMHRRLLN